MAPCTAITGQDLVNLQSFVGGGCGCGTRKARQEDKKIRENTEQRLFPMQCDRTVTLLSIMDGAEEVGT
jgi:hypothetical protein